MVLHVTSWLSNLVVARIMSRLAELRVIPAESCGSLLSHVATSWPCAHWCALVRALNPRASEKTIGKVWYDLNKAVKQGGPTLVCYDKNVPNEQVHPLISL